MILATAAVVIVVALAGTGAADPVRECKPSGRVLFEIDQRADPNHKLVTATTKLYANGAFHTDVLDVDGKPMRAQVGCLEPSQVDGIRDDLRGARWTVTHPATECRSYSPRFTVYRWNGRTVYTERSCGDTIDADSRDTLERLAFWVRAPDDLDGANQRPRGRGIHVAPECLANPLARGCT